MLCGCGRRSDRRFEISRHRAARSSLYENPSELQQRGECFTSLGAILRLGWRPAPFHRDTNESKSRRVGNRLAPIRSKGGRSLRSARRDCRKDHGGQRALGLPLSHSSSQPDYIRRRTETSTSPSSLMGAMAKCPGVPPSLGSSRIALNGGLSCSVSIPCTFLPIGTVSHADNPAGCPGCPLVSFPGRGVKLSRVKFPQT